MAHGQPKEAMVGNDVPLGTAQELPWAAEPKVHTRSEQIRECEDTLARAAVEIDRLMLTIRALEQGIQEREAQRKPNKNTQKEVEDVREHLSVAIGEKNLWTECREQAERRLVELRRDRWHEDRRERAKAREHDPLRPPPGWGEGRGR